MDKVSGTQLEEFRLEAPPVFNGIAAAGNRAYLCLTNGTVVGLEGRLLLHNNGGDELEVTAAGGFTFATEIELDQSYDITVAAAPGTQACSVDNGNGIGILPVDFVIAPHQFW